MTTIPNLLLFCGSGRHIGKTALLCSVIKHNKDKYNIAAIKISPNFHSEFPADTVIEKGDGFNIYREKELSDKDTSLFLQAGAKVSYYIESENQQIEKAFNIVHQLFGKDQIIICESGKLANHIKPGLMVFINSTDEKAINDNKKTNSELADVTIDVSGGKLDFYIEEINQMIVIENGQWKVK